MITESMRGSALKKKRPSARCAKAPIDLNRVDLETTRYFTPDGASC